MVSPSEGPYLVESGISPDFLPMERSGDPLSHVSVVVNDLCVRLGHLPPRDPSAEQSATPDRQAYWELGNSFEEGIVLGLTAMGRTSRLMQSDPDRFIRPGPLELDGLTGNPDLLDLQEEAVLEVKLTKISSRHDPESEKFWKYWAQGKSYAKMMGWRTVILHIGHINADYNRDNIDPHYNVWRWDFSDQQLDENWAMIRNHSLRLRGVSTGVKRKVTRHNIAR